MSKKWHETEKNVSAMGVKSARRRFQWIYFGPPAPPPLPPMWPTQVSNNPQYPCRHHYYSSLLTIVRSIQGYKAAVVKSVHGVSELPEHVHRTSSHVDIRIEPPPGNMCTKHPCRHLDWANTGTCAQNIPADIWIERTREHVHKTSLQTFGLNGHILLRVTHYKNLFCRYPDL